MKENDVLLGLGEKLWKSCCESIEITLFFDLFENYIGIRTELERNILTT